MVLKISSLICVLLIFDYKILASNKQLNNNVIKVYAPNHVLQPLYTALDAIPGLQYRTELNSRDGLVGRHDIDLTYYDDREEDSNPTTATLQGPVREMFNSQGRHLYRKNRALPATYAGYTANPDTCKLYNHNLLRIWNILSKHVDGDRELPDKIALHNIAQLINAYLDHHDFHDSTVKTNIAFTDKNENAIKVDFTDTLIKIKELLVEAVDEDITNKIVNLIVENDNITSLSRNHNLECVMNAKEELIANVNKEFQQYLDDSTCRRGSNVKIDLSLNQKDEDLNRNRIQARQLKHSKMDLLDTNKFLRQWQNTKFENCFTTARDTFLEKIKTAINDYLMALQCSHL